METDLRLYRYEALTQYHRETRSTYQAAFRVQA